MKIGVFIDQPELILSNRGLNYNQVIARPSHFINLLVFVAKAGLSSNIFK